MEPAGKRTHRILLSTCILDSALIIHSVAGYTAWFWHLCSLLLHLLMTWVVFRLSLELLRSQEAAFLTASMFAIYPIHVEAVSWISASNEILFSVFFAGSFALFVSALNSQISGGRLLSVVLWAASLFSKETAIALAPIFPIIAFVHWRMSGAGDEPRARRALRESTAYIAVGVAYLAVRFLVLGRTALETGQHSWSQVFFTASSLIPFYVGKLIFPVRLAPFYANRSIDSPDPMFWLGMALLVCWMLLLIWAIVKHNLIVSVILCLFGLPLVPVLIGIRIFRDGDLVHDRYLYLSSVGVCLIAGALLKFFWTKSKRIKRLAVASFSSVGVLFCWLTFSQQAFYRNDDCIFQRALAIGPTNSLVMTFLGDAYLRDGKDDLAFQELRRARDVSPNDFEVNYHLARALFETKRYTEAEPYLAQLANDPNTPFTRRGLLSLSLAQTEIRLGRLTAANSVLQSMEPQYDGLKGYHQARAVLYESAGRVSDARAEYIREYQISGDESSRRRASVIERLEFRKSETQ
jgi:Flp pilus assembly protein TadD